MSVFSLRELSAQVPAHASLLDLFQQCREHVVAVAATHLLPDTVAVTTRAGFVELIDTRTGAFRLFLTHLNTTPLDATLRCFSLVPGLVAASSPDLTHAQQYLAYSLSYSNELLIAHVDSGQVQTLASFTTRPSVVFCDGDYVACGEGCGQVSVWRLSTENRQPQQLWRAALFEDAVTSLRIHRDVIIGCAADSRCVACHVDTGAVVARLVQESDPAICVVPLTKPLTHRTVIAVCFPRRFSVYQSSAAEPETAVGMTSSWLYQGGLSLDREIQCASTFGEYLATGTASGVVMLFSCDAARGCVAELVRFDVGFGVVAVQLYGSGTLLVVTTAGDVWRWPVADLLPSESAADVDEAPEAEMNAPLPSAPPPTTPPQESSDAPKDADPVHVPGEKGSTHETDAHNGDAPLSHPVTSPALVDARGTASTSSSSSLGTETNQKIVDAEAHEDDDATHGATEGNRTIVMEVSFDDGGEGVCDGDQSKGVDATACAYSSSSSSSSVPPCGVHVPHERTTRADDVVPHDDCGALTEYHEREERATTPAALVALQDALGSHPTIEGLRRGPRMDPRKVASVLQTAAVRQMAAEEHDKQDNTATSTPTGALASSRSAKESEFQSTRMLEACRDALLGQHVSEMDVDAYAAEHRLEAEALLYKYPVRQPHYGLEARVFDLVGPSRAPALEPCEGQPALSAVDINAMPMPMSAKQLKVLSKVKDDLVEETYGRITYKQDPALVAERQRGGPAMDLHYCNDVLHVPCARPTTAVLFHAIPRRARSCAPLVLPLPLPATPSAF